MRPAADGRPEQAGHVGRGQDAADDAEAEIEPGHPGVDDGERAGREGLRVGQEVADPPGQDRAGHGPDGDRQEVVGAQVLAPGEDRRR